ncbi:hypothetical protein Cgig2_005187 [Carnegiea gigantea]|uniref:Uncharacterized protein n=1 Tax=Carnegiea gigantea TaxID=171969 RepID=A0A9Q1KGC3_9CARY|nr:hypothetical protein Cgig2_005187 [Carnegiea gigantea]
MRILESDATLIYVADAVGDTIFHVVARARRHTFAPCCQKPPRRAGQVLVWGNIKAIFIVNNDGLRPQGISKAHGFSTPWCYMKFCLCADIEMATRMSALWNENEDSSVDKRTRVIRLLKVALEGEEDNVRQFLEEDPSLVLHKDPRWGTALHAAAMGGHVDMLRLLARFTNHDQQVMPISSVSPSIRQTLVMPPNKSFVALAALKARNLGILEAIMKDLPNLINVLDYKGWRILSYATYKERYDSGGSLPIHKAVGGGQISIIKEFLLHCPQRLYDVDRKGRTILHFAVKCTKANVLSYLTKETEVEKSFSSRDHEGKTFMDLAEELKSVVVGRSIPSGT